MDSSAIDCVIYHADCSDGFGAAWAAWKALGSRAEYIPAMHGKPPPDVKGKNVIILDFAYDKKTTKKMIKDATSFVMRDHHKSAMINLEGVAKPDWFQLDHSGCILSWEFFHPGVPAPRFLKFIENRDMGWKPYMEYSREFSTAFDMIPFEFRAYDQMLNASFVDSCIERGSHIITYADNVIEKACKNAVRKKLRGYDVLVTNASHWISEIGTKLAPDCDFALVWFWNHAEKYAKVSLRSFHPDVDCGTIAKRFNGGGHADIAGFEHHGNIEEIFGKLDMDDDLVEQSSDESLEHDEEFHNSDHEHSIVSNDEEKL